jgi:hypothetical protein
LQYAGAPEFRAPLLLVAVLTLFAFIGVVVLVKQGRERATLSLLLLWLMVPIALPFLLSQIVTPLYEHRYSIAALPALYLLVAVGMLHIGRVAVHAIATIRATTKRVMPLAALAVAGALFSVIGFSSLSMLHSYYTTPKKEPWRDVASQVERYAKPSDTLVVSKRYMRTPYHFYARENNLPQNEIALDPEQISDVRLAVRDSNRVWLLLTYLEEKQIKDFKGKLKQEEFKVADHKLYNDGKYAKIDLTLYEK